MKIVFFGDSITEGYFGVSYVDKVKQKLEQQLTAGIQVFNLGRAGDGVIDLLWRVQTVRPPGEKYPVAVLGIGVNDVYFGGTLPDAAGFFDTYREILKLILEEWAEELVIFPPLLVADKENDPGNRQLTWLAQEIKDLLQEYRQAVFIDIHQLFMERIAQGEVLTIDGVHLNEKGAALLADRLAEELGKKEIR